MLLYHQLFHFNGKTTGLNQDGSKSHERYMFCKVYDTIFRWISTYGDKSQDFAKLAGKRTDIFLKILFVVICDEESVKSYIHIFVHLFGCKSPF